MKPARNSETKIMRNGDTMWGICLGADYAAEHEYGIRYLLQKVNIDPDGICVIGRSMTSPISLHKTKGSNTKAYYLEDDGKPVKKKMSGTVLGTRDMKYSDVINRAPLYQLSSELSGAWSQSDFVAVAWSDDAKIILDDLDKAFLSGNITIWLGGGGDNPFSRNNLIIAITDRIPAEGAEQINETDLERQKLQDAAKQTGIEEYLIAAFDGKSWFKKPWYALTPRWSEDNTVVFYLNPTSQDKYNSGWFSVDELKQWAEGEGPVVK